MKLRISCVIVGFLSLVLFTSAQTPDSNPPAPSASAQVPRLIRFSGVAKDTDSKPLTGTSGITFLLYEDQQGGAPLWMETQNVQPDSSGHYSVQLGATKSSGLPTDVFTSGEARWLAVQISGQAEQPRVLLLSVPYALKAADAETIGGLPPSAFMKAMPAQQTGTNTGESSAPAATGALHVAGKSSHTPNPPVTGSGTAGDIPLWDTSGDIMNSIMSQTGISTINVAGAVNVQKDLQVLGDLRVDFKGHNKGTDSPGIRFGTGNTGEAISSNRAGTANVAGLDFYTDYLARMSITNGGNVGIGTATPRSILEADTNSPRALGPVLTLTNTGGNPGAAASIDLNSYAPSTNGTYNPAARIKALDDDYSDDILFQSNVPGKANNTLQTNMTILADGQVLIGTTTQMASQLHVVGSGVNNGVEAIGGGPSTIAGSGVFGQGGLGQGGEINFGGDGGDFMGGNGLTPGYGVWAQGGENSQSSADAGYFNGNVTVTGTLTAGTKDFKIDHPLDPANKYLYHASVESSEMMNIYTGNLKLDADGQATVELPKWFQAENTDFRYTLTCIGGFAPIYIAEEISGNTFKVAGGKPGMKVSWQVTGLRQDAYAKAHPLQVEVEKPVRERGYYIHPELYGAPQEKSIEWGRNPAMMKKIIERRERATRQQASH